MVARFASALAFVFTLAVVLVAAGCGARFDSSGGPPPTEEQLASDAYAALKDAGSAHVVLAANGGSISGTDAQLNIHFEGDVSASAISGLGTVAFPAGALGVGLAVDEHHLYVRFMGEWYYADSGLSDLFSKANEKGGAVLAQLSTPAGFGRFFADIVDGEVTQGPDVDGVSTWQFAGRLSADALAKYVQLGGNELTAGDRAQLQKVADTSHVLVVVGQEDHLPRKVELTLEPPAGLKFDSPQLQSSDGPFSLKVELSDFGKDVSFTAPKDAKPLDALAEQLFGLMG
jgi:hypothetical protein